MTSPVKKQTLPAWLLLYSLLISLIPIGLGLMGYLNPLGQFSDLAGDTAALSLGGPLGLFIARNVATGVATGFALYRRSPDMLLVMFVLRLVTDVLDFTHLLISGEALFPAIALWAFAFWAPTLVGIWTLWPMTTSRPSARV
jgi:hypothetical protein